MHRLFYAGGAIALLVLAAWVAVPLIAHAQLESRLTEVLGRTTTVESVAFDLTTLRLVIRNLAIADKTAQRPLFALDELVANVSAASLWHRAPVFDAVKLTRPRVLLARERDGRYNVQDLVDRALAPRPPGPPPQFSFNNIEIDDGAITLDDRLADRRHEIAALTIAVPFVSSLPYAADIRVTPRMEGTFNGSHFALKGSATPFAERRETTLDIDLDALRLPPYVAYLPSRPTLELVGGALTTRLTIAFVEQGPTDHRLELRGNAQLDGLAIKRRDESPLVAADRIAVALDRVQVFDRQARIASVAIVAPRADIRRLADGTLELARPILDTPRETAGPTPSPARETPAALERPWQLSVAKLSIDHGTIALADESSGIRSTLADVKLDATSLSTAPGEKAHVKLAFVSEDRIASFSGEADVDPTAPAATGRFELAKFSLKLLFPYYSEVLDVDVQKGSLDLAAGFSVDAGGNLTLSDGVGTISELSLALPGNRSPLWRVPILTATGVDVDVRARKVTFGELKSHGPSLRIVRERDGSLEFARVLKTGQAKDAPTAGAEWTIATTRASTERGAIDFEDRVPTPAVKLAIRDVDLLVSDLSNARAAKSQFKLSGRIGEHGRMAFAGPVATRPLSLSGTLEASGLALVALKPYFEHEVNIVVTDGVFAAKGQVGLDVPDGAAVRASWKGEMKVTDFASFDKPTSSDLARWKSLVVEGMDIANEPFHAATGRIALEDFYARVIVYPDATINIARLVTPGASPEPAPDAKPAPPAQRGAPSEALPVSIGRIELTRGNVVFSDLFVRPNYSANLTDVAGSVSAMSAKQAGDVALTASVDGIAPVEVQGRIHPFASELSLDLTGKARDIELPPLTPYSVKYAGYGIEKGKLTFDVRYRVENRKLAAENRLVLDQLTFGERVESPTATKLPILHALALLKDRHGVIDIQLPISGSLDDPQFSVGDLIARVIVNQITKAVTAPFALLASAFGSGEELSTLAFAPGSASIAADAQKRIDTLGKALADRPALKLDIGGRADPVTDRDAGRRAAVETAIRREKMKSLAVSGNTPASIDQVTIGAEERNRWLTEAYRSAPLPDRPRNALGMLKDVPPGEMEAMLFADAKVDDDALRDLANRRAQAVKDAILATGVAGERLFLIAPRLSNEADGEKVAAGETPGTLTRADLALR
jgi:hypothetical protein